MQDPQLPPEPQFSGSIPPADAFQPPAAQAGYTPVSDYSQQQYPPQGYLPPGNYAQPPYTPPGAIVPADQGLSDTAAGALAYITIIPAIIFLVLAPYNTRPFVKFHAFQCLGLAVVGFCLSVVAIIPILGQIVFLVGWIAMLVVWVMSLVKASQGSYLKLPVISDFASRQSGYPIA